MKISLIEWGHLSTFAQKGEPYLVKMPNTDLSTTASELDHMTGHKPNGVVPLFDFTNLAYGFRCAATARDQISLPIYAPVATWCIREALSALRGAAFQHFVVEFVDPWEPFFHRWHDLVEGKRIHVAGGNPKWVEPNPNWSWSEEAL